MMEGEEWLRLRNTDEESEGTSPREEPPRRGNCRDRRQEELRRNRMDQHSQETTSYYGLTALLLGVLPALYWAKAGPVSELGVDMLACLWLYKSLSIPWRRYLASRRTGVETHSPYLALLILMPMVGAGVIPSLLQWWWPQSLVTKHFNPYLYLVGALLTPLKHLLLQQGDGDLAARVEALEQQLRQTDNADPVYPHDLGRFIRARFMEVDKRMVNVERHLARQMRPRSTISALWDWALSCLFWPLDITRALLRRLLT